MRLHSILRLTVLAALPLAALGQPLGGPPADPQLKFSTPRPPGVYSPDKVETRLGTLNFVDGFPDKASAEKLFDNLDFQRAVPIGSLGVWLALWSTLVVVAARSRARAAAATMPPPDAQTSPGRPNPLWISHQPAPPVTRK